MWPLAICISSTHWTPRLPSLVFFLYTMIAYIHSHIPSPTSKFHDLSSWDRERQLLLSSQDTPQLTLQTYIRSKASRLNNHWAEVIEHAASFMTTSTVNSDNKNNSNNFDADMGLPNLCAIIDLNWWAQFWSTSTQGLFVPFFRSKSSSVVHSHECSIHRIRIKGWVSPACWNVVLTRTSYPGFLCSKDVWVILILLVSILVALWE